MVLHQIGHLEVKFLFKQIMILTIMTINIMIINLEQ